MIADIVAGRKKTDACWGGGKPCCRGQVRHFATEGLLCAWRSNGWEAVRYAMFLVEPLRR